MNRGNAKQSALGHGPSAATADYDRAIALQEALREGQGDNLAFPWRHDLAAAYVNRGIAKVSAPGWGPTAAIAEYDAAIDMLESGAAGDPAAAPYFAELLKLAKRFRDRTRDGLSQTSS